MSSLSHTADVSALINQAQQQAINFSDVLAFIEDNYQFTPVAFRNGKQENSADENQGSAKVFGFAKLNNLSQQDTLQLFVEHYQSVLDTPAGDNHSNIRNFMQFGWDGLKMDANPLTAK